jgi:hypothetical protein
MTHDELVKLKAEYPEAPMWLAARRLTLEQAREVMRLRRKASPKTAPTEEEG